MKDPKIKTEIKHSETKSAWNVVGTSIGAKYKIARVPYITTNADNIDSRFRKEAHSHAEFIDWFFNHSEEIISKFKLKIAI